MTKAREKAIKLYWKIAKERCPFQDENMVNSFLEGFIDCAEYLLLQNTELKEKLNIRSCQNCKRNNRTCPNDSSCKHYSKWEGYENSHLTKAKEIIKNLMVFAEMDCREYEEAYKEAEQFIKEE